jgi:AraC-like DNA-binding protein
VEGKLLTMKEWEDVARKADYNPGKMAALCSISERQMQRLFQQHVKCTPSRWLRGLQCRLAKQLISQGYSNKAVAAELKFSSQSHFCREFKKVFGASPQNFARAQDSNPPASRKISRESWTALAHRPAGRPEGASEKGALRGAEAALPPNILR